MCVDIDFELCIICICVLQILVKKLGSMKYTKNLIAPFTSRIIALKSQKFCKMEVKLLFLLLAVNFFSTGNRTSLFRVKDSDLLLWLHCLGF